MTILEDEVLVELSGGTNIKYYESLNYEIPRIGKYKKSVKRGTKILVKVKELSKGSQVNVTKICDECGKITKNVAYGEIINSRENGDGKDRCYKCGKKKAALTRINNVDYKMSLEFYANENNLEYLLNEFSDKNGIDPKNISYGSNKIYWWNCYDCKSEYDMQMIKRTTREFKCPYCKGRRVNHTNSLGDLSPEIANEWNIILNKGLTSFEVYNASTKKYWWTCVKCKSDFDSSPYNRIHNIGCPYCSGQKVNTTNCVATINPEFIKEWHPTKNGKITPYNTSYGSTKKIWWKCKFGHEWNTTVSHRREGNGCPVCSESKGEKRIRKWLTCNGIEFISQKMFKGLIGVGGGNLSFDFYLPNHNLLIEYQGKQHEEYCEGLHKNKNDFKKQQEHDQRKHEYATKNKIKLLEIWYFDFDNIDSILNKEELNVRK